MRKTRKIKVTKAAANNPKPGEVSQLELEIGEVIALMPGDKVLLKFDQRRKTFAGFYIVDVEE